MDLEIESLVESGEEHEKEIINSVNDKIILVADDNADIVQYLTSIFSDEYRVLCAKDGVEALKLTKSYIPDLVISDVMMPKKTGIELCSELKQNESTSHIPVILLTAKDEAESKVEGYDSGADDYITKPFQAEVIKSRIKNLIESRSKLRKLFHVEQDKIDDEVESEEFKFLKKVESMIVDNLDSSEFSVPMLARELGYSRTSLYRKIKALTDHSINQFIRSVKMKKAAELLGSSDITVSEVAFSLGFTDLKYFRSCFKEQFNILPSEYQKQNSHREVDIDALKSALKLN
jgi:DNA-binding response OmpR family regulator